VAVRDRKQVAVGDAARFAERKFVIADVEGEQVGIARLPDGTWRAVRNHCPHKGAPICRGQIGGTWPPSAPGELAFERDGEVLVCPWQGFEYDLKTGKEMNREVPTRLRLYDVEVREGIVYVTV
jgi:nitrite reductase (NADH) small subunit